MNKTTPENASLEFLVIDDHESVLSGTVEVLRRHYPTSKFVTAINAENAYNQLMNLQPNLLVMDLSIPEKPGITARPDTGVRLLRTLMKTIPI